MKQVLDIKSVNLEQLNNLEYAHFIKSTLNLIQNVTLEKINLEQEVYDALVKYQDDLTEATRQTRFSTETQRIVELDKQRGDYVVFLLSSFRFERKNSIVKRKEAAFLLHKVMKRYAGIQSLPSGQKTQTIEGFLKDINKPEYEKAVSDLGIEHTITALTKANQEYQKLVAGRAENQLANTLINTKKVRKEATRLYRYMAKCAFGTHIVTQSEESANFINLLNKLIIDTTNANKLRLSQIAIGKSSSTKEEIKKME